MRNIFLIKFSEWKSFFFCIFVTEPFIWDIFECSNNSWNFLLIIVFEIISEFRKLILCRSEVLFRFSWKWEIIKSYFCLFSYFYSIHPYIKIERNIFLTYFIKAASQSIFFTKISKFSNTFSKIFTFSYRISQCDCIFSLNCKHNKSSSIIWLYDIFIFEIHEICRCLLRFF